MKPEEFENRLRSVPARPVPREWRAQILSAAQKAAERQDLGTSEPSKAQAKQHTSVIFAMLHALSPSRLAWSGIVAVWVVIAALQFASRDSHPELASKPPVPDAEVQMAVKQQRQLMAELLGQSPTLNAQPRDPVEPRPRSSRRETVCVV